MLHTVELTPELGIGHLYLSKCYLHQKNPQSALKSYNQAIFLDNKLKDVNYWIDIQDGLCERLIKSREYNKAIAIYKNVLEKIEKDTESTAKKEYYKRRVHLTMANVYYKAGNLDQSIAIYEDILLKTKKEENKFDFLSFNDDILIHKNLSKIYKEKNDPQKAQFHKKEAEVLERKENIIMAVIMGFPLSIFTGGCQFIAIFVMFILLSIFLLLPKSRAGLRSNQMHKLSWSFKDVSSIYIKAFLLPLLAYIIGYMLLTYYSSAQIFVFSFSYIFAILIGILSLIIFWIISNKRFKKKFQLFFPDISWTSAIRIQSIFVLNLWQMLAAFLGICILLFISIGSVYFIFN